MPGLDHTGPMGQGAMTGRKMGECASGDSNNISQRGTGQGLGRGAGAGRGAGRGLGRGAGRGLGRGAGRAQAQGRGLGLRRGFTGGFDPDSSNDSMDPAPEMSIQPVGDPIPLANPIPIKEDSSELAEQLALLNKKLDSMQKEITELKKDKK